MLNEKAIIAKLSQIVTPEFSFQLAKQVGFVQRSTSRLQGYEIAQALCLPNQAAESLNGLSDRLKRINRNTKMSVQGLVKRLNKESLVHFMRGYLAKILQDVHVNDEMPILDGFNQILIEDSTGGQLHQKLSSTFRGSGGSASSAAFKINLIYSYKTQNILELLLTHGKTTDQSLANHILKWLKPNDLVIRDLGYFSTKAFSKIENIGAYFLSRFPPKVNVYLNQHDKEPICLWKHLKGSGEIQAYVGEKERIKVRLIFYEVSQDVLNERLRKIHLADKKRGNTSSKEKLRLQKWTIFITNVPEEKLAKEVAWNIYRLRWQIELMFKRWKSILHIHVLKGTNPYRIEAFIIGRLCMILILGILESWAHQYAERHLRQLSPTKLWNFLLRDQRLLCCFLKRSFEELLEEIKTEILSLYMDKRQKRKTTFEIIQSKESYIRSFDNKKQPKKAA